jgi:hypothetical protein
LHLDLFVVSFAHLYCCKDISCDDSLFYKYAEIMDICCDDYTRSEALDICNDDFLFVYNLTYDESYTNERGGYCLLLLHLLLLAHP